MHAAVMFSVLEMAGMGVITLFLGDAKAFIGFKRSAYLLRCSRSGRITFTAELTDEQKTNREVLSITARPLKNPFMPMLMMPMASKSRMRR